MKNSFYIKDILIPSRLVLAPMAGISNTSYRKIVKKMGVGLIYAEMVSSNALTYGNNKTLELLKMSEEERPIAQQIFGSDVDTFVASAKIVEEKMHPDMIDINMGCPVPKVALRAQAGSALLKNPEKIREIVRAVVKAVIVLVSVKIRSGWDEENINAPLVAKVCEEAGASAIAIHARTRKQGYSGQANWNIIKKVKETVSIPVIGNGDVDSPEKALKMLEYENIKIPDDINYDLVHNIAKEAKQKLSEIRPTSIGQAMRISGVNPADITMLMVHLKRNRKND